MANFNSPVVKALTAARISLLFHAPFFGNLATRCTLTDAAGRHRSIFADGIVLLYASEFVAALTHRELVTRLKFEVLHYVYEAAIEVLGLPRAPTSQLPAEYRMAGFAPLSKDDSRKVLAGALHAAQVCGRTGTPASFQAIMDANFTSEKPSDFMR